MEITWCSKSHTLQICDISFLFLIVTMSLLLLNTSEIKWTLLYQGEVTHKCDSVLIGKLLCHTEGVHLDRTRRGLVTCTVNDWLH